MDVRILSTARLVVASSPAILPIRTVMVSSYEPRYDKQAAVPASSRERTAATGPIFAKLSAPSSGDC
jgi:hypothetical protein